MSAYMSRSAAIFWRGKENVPNNVHHYATEGYNSELKPVTWNEVFKDRTKKQIDALKKKRYSELVRKAAILQVFFNPYFPFTGYWIYLKFINSKNIAINHKNFYEEEDIALIRNTYPLGLLPFTDFTKWCETFIQQHKKTTKKGNPNGTVKCWVTLKNKHLIKIEI